MKINWMRPLGVFSGMILLAVCVAAQTTKAPQVPVVDGGIGACLANFTVKDGTGKPIYNAKIDTTIHYGFMNLRKTELQVSTNSDGKACIAGLPEFPKKPVAFKISSGTVSRTITDDPNTSCNATFDVELTVH